MKRIIEKFKKKTGRTPSDFKDLAEKKGFTQNGKIKNGVKTTQITHWVKQDFALGHGHAMAIYAFLKGKKPD